MQTFAVLITCLAACAGARAEREPPLTPSPATIAEPVRLAEAPQPEPAFVDLCGQAYACCRAYVASLPGGGGIDAVTACEPVRTLSAEAGGAAKQSCELMLDGWTQGLTAARLPVPDVCRRSSAQPTVQVSPASSNP